jgi:hypothetical protein
MSREKCIIPYFVVTQGLTAQGIVDSKDSLRSPEINGEPLSPLPPYPVPCLSQIDFISFLCYYTSYEYQ